MNKYQKSQEILKKKQQKQVNKTILDTVKIMKQVNETIKAIIQRAYEKYELPKILDGKPDAAATTNYLNQKIKSDYGTLSRLNILKLDIVNAIKPLLLKRDKLIEKQARASYLGGYYLNAFALSQNVKKKVRWKKVGEKEVNKAVNENPLSIFKSKEI